MSNVAESIRLHPELSERQQRILDYVSLVISRDDGSPSLREIAEACDVSSTSVVDYNVSRLVALGLLVRGGEANDQRRIRLPVNPWRQLVDDAEYIFGMLQGVDYGGFIAGHIAGWRERRGKLMRGE